MKIDLVPLISPVHDAARVERQLPWLREIEGAAGLTFVWREPVQPLRAEPTVYFIRTGGTEQQFAGLARDVSRPVYLLVYPGENSLAAALEILTYVRRAGGRGEIVQGKPQTIAARLALLARTAAALQRMNRARLGVVGQPSDWLIGSHVDADAVVARWGARLVEVPMAEMEALVRPVAQHDRWLTDLSRAANSCAPTTAVSLDWVQGMYAALHTLRQRYQLDALTLRCFDLLGRFQQTGCLPLARLNDEGIPAGCEGDVPALFAMTLSFYLTGRPSFMSNPALVDLERNQIVLAHCTVPPSLVNALSLPTHFESGLGLGIRGEMPAGRCVMLRVGGAGLDQVWLSGGTIVENLEQSNMCRTQILVQADEDLGEMLANPLGNHRIVVPGDHLELFETFFQQADVRINE